MKILFAGGGSGGPVSPLLALAHEFRRRMPDAAFLWVGTNDGPENKLVDLYQIEFQTIACGKLRRYFSLQNFLDIARIAIGFFQSLKIIIQFKPDWIISAGGYVAVPLIWAGWLCRVKILVHQQDVEAGLANRLTAPLATVVTVTFTESQKYFKRQTVLTGNPVRPDILTGDANEARKIFKLEADIPTILVTGGGTGALDLNRLFNGCRQRLIAQYQIIHLTGGKANDDFTHPRYHRYDFLGQEMKHALTVADIIITRAGMSALSELTILQKPMIIVPIPNSHQEANARLYGQKNAAIVVDQKSATAESLCSTIEKSIADASAQAVSARVLSTLMPKNAAAHIIDTVLQS